jgi:hypothetical protein
MSVKDAIDNLKAGEMTQFRTAVSDELMQRVSDNLDLQKQKIAMSLFNQPDDLDDVVPESPEEVISVEDPTNEDS